MNGDRKLYDIGDHKIFRLSKDRCQLFLYALLVCQGQIHDSCSFSLDSSRTGMIEGISLFQVDALWRISLPVGRESLFESIFGKNTLEEIPIIEAN